MALMCRNTCVWWNRNLLLLITMDTPIERLNPPAVACPIDGHDCRRASWPVAAHQCGPPTVASLVRGRSAGHRLTSSSPPLQQHGRCKPPLPPSPPRVVVSDHSRGGDHITHALLSFGSDVESNLDLTGGQPRRDSVTSICSSTSSLSSAGELDESDLELVFECLAASDQSRPETTAAVCCLSPEPLPQVASTVAAAAKSKVSSILSTGVTVAAAMADFHIAGSVLAVDGQTQNQTTSSNGATEHANMEDNVDGATESDTESDPGSCWSSSDLDQDLASTTGLTGSRWTKLRCLVTSPFMQTYKRKKYPWIQLAGHQGNFLSGSSQGTILKKLCGNEAECFRALMADPELCTLVPAFQDVVVRDGERYLELEDLLAGFVNPSVMDIKMGTRTYLEEELVKAQEKPKLRKDMYDKMVAIDPDEPCPEEHAQRAITKPRYMVWRESISSTSTLGFRIEGIKLSSNPLKTNTSTRDLKRTKSEEAVRSTIMEFCASNPQSIPVFLSKLRLIRQRLQRSSFFNTHEMIGSSLLFVHDHQHADVWMIDFAKTYPLPETVRINHQDRWRPGNHEDGYLFGLDNLIAIFVWLEQHWAGQPPSPS